MIDNLGSGFADEIHRTLAKIAAIKRKVLPCMSPPKNSVGSTLQYGRLRNYWPFELAPKFCVKKRQKLGRENLPLFGGKPDLELIYCRQQLNFAIQQGIGRQHIQGS
jgi:hypothetical protein